MKTHQISGWGASSTAPGYDRLISKREAAGILGVSVRTVEKLISDGKLHAQKVGGCVRLRLSQVLQFAGIESEMITLQS